MPVTKKTRRVTKRRANTLPAVSQAAAQAYWRANLLLILGLLLTWALLGLGCGVLFADALNRYRVLGMPAGFFMAQIGAIVGFVILIGIYARVMDRLDRAHGMHGEGA